MSKEGSSADGKEEAHFSVLLEQDTKDCKRKTPLFICQHMWHLKTTSLFGATFTLSLHTGKRRTRGLAATMIVTNHSAGAGPEVVQGGGLGGCKNTVKRCSKRHKAFNKAFYV